MCLLLMRGRRSCMVPLRMCSKLQLVVPAKNLRVTLRARNGSGAGKKDHKHNEKYSRSVKREMGGGRRMMVADHP